MTHTKSVALLAVLAFTMMSASAFAAPGVAGPPPPPPPPNNPGDPDLCVVLCNSIPPKDPGSPVSTNDKAFQVCGDKLAQLRRVTVSEIKSVAPGDAVRIIPVCETQSRTLTEAETVFTGRGNVSGLLTAIGELAPGRQAG